MSYLLSVQAILAALRLLEYSPAYFTMANRNWNLTTFNTGFPLFLPQTIILSAVTLWIAYRKPTALIALALGLIIYPFLGLEATVEAVSIICLGTCLWLNEGTQKFAFGIVVAVGLLEVQALLHWFVFAPLGLQNPFMGLVEFERSLYYNLAQLSPFIMIFFSLATIVIPISYFYSKTVNSGVNGKNSSHINRREALTFLIILTLSIIAAVYPYLPNINPDNKNPGVDIVMNYQEALRVEADPYQALHVYNGTRPLYYLVLFGFQKMTGLSLLDAVRFLPVLINPLLVLSVFYLAREIFGKNRSANLAAFFTVAGYQLSVGMYAYFLTDMLSLSIIFLSIGFLLTAQRNKNKADLIIAMALGCLLVFTHPWTFDQYIAAITVAALLVTYLSIKKRDASTNPLQLLVYCIVVASVDILKMILLGGSVGSLAALDTLAAGLTTPQTLWLDLLNSSRFYVSGYLTNIPILSLSVLGMIKAREKTTQNLLLWAFMAMTSVLYLIGDTVIKSRLIFNIPIGIFAAYGIQFINDLKMDDRLKKAIIITIIITLMAYLFRDLANLV